MNRRATAALGGGLVALIAAWRFAGPGTPPLYDGPQIVAPYLYVCIPNGYHQSHPALPKTQQAVVSNGQLADQGLFASTEETGVAQAQVLIGGQSLVLPTGATEVTLTISPVEPPAVLPTDGSLNGNVYTVSVTSGGKPVGLAPGQSWTLVLRGEPGKATSVLEQFDGTGWHKAELSQPVGQADVYAGNFTSFGTFGLVAPGAPGSPAPCRTFAQAGEPGSSQSGGGTGGTGTGGGGGSGSGGGGSALLPILAVVGGLVLLGGGVVAVRARK